MKSIFPTKDERYMAIFFFLLLMATFVYWVRVKTRSIERNESLYLDRKAVDYSWIQKDDVAVQVLVWEDGTEKVNMWVAK